MIEAGAVVLHTGNSKCAENCEQGTEIDADGNHQQLKQVPATPISLSLSLSLPADPNRTLTSMTPLVYWPLRCHL